MAEVTVGLLVLSYLWVVVLGFALYTSRRRILSLERKLKERKDLEKFALGGKKQWHESVFGQKSKLRRN
jgi:hypothetical protein